MPDRRRLARLLKALGRAYGEVCLEGTQAVLLLPPGRGELVEEARGFGRELAHLALLAPRGRLPSPLLLALGEAAERGGLEEAKRVLRHMRKRSAEA
ncbi:MAG: hypothetical protein ACP5JV_06735 [Thermus sp.]|uniref:hypothetical protein n=1 Tax=Thermus sp. TaxID=275 RepID=UPI003D132833